MAGYIVNATRENFYPRPPRGGRLSACPHYIKFSLFLSTPSARRATKPPLLMLSIWHYFYPRPPRGGRRLAAKLPPRDHDFYPRPPRGGRRVSRVRARERDDFYPRPPRGGRRTEWMEQSDAEIFLSTPSARRATVAHGKSRPASPISIHALREEGDSSAPRVVCSARNFYPRPPRGGRQKCSTTTPGHCRFLSTPSARRATCCHDYY